MKIAISGAGYQVQSIRSVGGEGQIQASLGVDAFRRAAGGDLTSVPRGDLAAAIYATIEHEAEAWQGDCVAAGPVTR